MDGYVTADSFAHLCRSDGLQGTRAAQPEVGNPTAEHGAMGRSVMAGKVLSGV